MTHASFTEIGGAIFIVTVVIEAIALGMVSWHCSVLSKRIDIVHHRISAAIKINGLVDDGWDDPIKIERFAPGQRPTS